MTRFENIKKMGIEEMARFFSTNSNPDFPHSPCYVCEYDGMCCAKPDSCTVEYKAEMYKKWLSQEMNT